MVAKAPKDPFTGKLIVLMDSTSSSASEIFARTIQLEKRGTVIGDLSAGSVMGARFFDHRIGAGSFVYFGAEITEMDLRMPDGQTLEKKGVTPDELLLPSLANLARDEDPVLAHAAELLGVNMSPAEAARLFPYEWPH
jgi:C-terminal processing protease CtpA/Prc